MIWVSFGDVSDIVEPISYSHAPGMGMAIHLMWLIFTNVLLLNLLISMMGERFRADRQRTHSAVRIHVCVCLCVRVCLCVCNDQ